MKAVDKYDNTTKEKSVVVVVMSSDEVAKEGLTATVDGKVAVSEETQQKIDNGEVTVNATTPDGTTNKIEQGGNVANPSTPTTPSTPSQPDNDNGGGSVVTPQPPVTPSQPETPSQPPVTPSQPVCSFDDGVGNSGLSFTDFNEADDYAFAILEEDRKSQTYKYRGYSVDAYKECGGVTYVTINWQYR